MAKTVTIEEDLEQPVERKVLAQSIVDISTAFKKLQASGLNRKAIITLVAKSSGQGTGVVDDILYSLENLAKEYTR